MVDRPETEQERWDVVGESVIQVLEYGRKNRILIRIIGVGYVVILFLVLFVGILTVQQFININHIKNNAATLEATQKADCDTYNVLERIQINAEKVEIRIATSALVAPLLKDVPLAKGLEQNIIAFYKIYDKTVVYAHPFRDCTSQGIANYVHPKK